MPAPAVTPLRLAVVGAGSRGMIYGREAVGTGTARVTAVAEPRADRRLAAAAEFGVPLNRCVNDWSDLAGVAGPRRRRGDHHHARPPAHRARAGLPGSRPRPAAGEADGADRSRGRGDCGRRGASGAIVCVAHVLRYSAYTGRGQGGAGRWPDR